MAYERRTALAVAAVLLTTSVVWAGYDEGVLITKSPQLEQTVSHVLVGQLIAFHERNETSGQFVAEIVVHKVEKGEGVQAGERIYIRFSSPLSLDRLRTDRVVADCGDRKIDPLPGEWMRVYTQFNENYEYIADHPSCFFYLSRTLPADASPGINRFVNLRTTLATSFALLIGFAAGFFVRPKRQPPTKSQHRIVTA